MNTRYATDSERIHFNSVFVDLHTYPSFMLAAEKGILKTKGGCHVSYRK